MKCHQCNKIIEDYEKICPHCGYFHDPEMKDFYEEEAKKKISSSEVVCNRDDYHEKGKRGIHAIKSLYTKTFNFLGVSDRGEFWTQLVFVWLFAFIFLSYENKLSNSLSQLSNFDKSMIIISGLMIVITFIPIISATVRRLHDAGYSGMWYFINLIPLVGGFVLIVLLAMPYQRNRYNDWLEKKNVDESPGNQVNYDI